MIMTSEDKPQNTPQDSPLGKEVSYESGYDPALLYPIERQPAREELNLGATMPFFGMDIWNAYELSWLNMRGKPQVGIMTAMVPADSPNIVESKSLKLYLNALSEEKIAGVDALTELLRADLTAACGSSVQVRVTAHDAFAEQEIQELEGLLVDRLDIEVEEYEPNPSLLSAEKGEPPIEEQLVSHLLKSTCPVTGQPDWASLQIHYIGAPINQEGLLRYLISLRGHSGFHEQCIERIYMDILRECKPQKLAIYGRYTRRGGLDINPWRTNFTTGKRPPNARNARQ